MEYCVMVFLRFFGGFIHTQIEYTFLIFAVLTFGKLRAILRRNHAAAIVNCSFQQRIPRIIAVLCLHIQNQTNQAILARCGGIKTAS